MDKRGQFYFIAAIIIVVLLSTLTSVSTYIIVKSEPQSVTYVADDISRESHKVVEWGIYNGKDVGEEIEVFASGQLKNYFLSKTAGESDIIFLYGDKKNSKLKALRYTKVSTGDISVGGG